MIKEDTVAEFTQEAGLMCRRQARASAARLFHEPGLFRMISRAASGAGDGTMAPGQQLFFDRASGSARNHSRHMFCFLFINNKGSAAMLRAKSREGGFSCFSIFF